MDTTLSKLEFQRMFGDHYDTDFNYKEVDMYRKYKDKMDHKIDTLTSYISCLTKCLMFKRFRAPQTTPFEHFRYDYRITAAYMEAKNKHDVGYEDSIIRRKIYKSFLEKIKVVLATEVSIHFYILRIRKKIKENKKLFTKRLRENKTFYDVTFIFN